jgi:IclR family acetate operon transcriptional repressor
MKRANLSLVGEPREVANETSSTLKAFGVLEVLVRAARAVTLSELMQATELPKPTLYRTLALFEEAGILSREPGGRAYMIGDRLSRFGLEILRNDAAASERRMVLRRVVSDIQESCNLAVLYKGALIYLDRIEANWPLRLQVPVGGASMPPHCCASGKLLLAHLPVAERQRLLEVMALERFTLRTITDRQVLSSELDRIVNAGYAVDNGICARRGLCGRAGAQSARGNRCGAGRAGRDGAAAADARHRVRAAATGGRGRYRFHIRITGRRPIWI